MSKKTIALLAVAGLTLAACSSTPADTSGTDLSDVTASSEAMMEETSSSVMSENAMMEESAAMMEDDIKKMEDTTASVASY